MWGWVLPLVKQIAQQRLGQQGKMGAIGSGLWQQAEERGGTAPPPTQAPMGFERRMNPITGGIQGGIQGAGQQSFLDAYWEYLMKQWGVR